MEKMLERFMQQGKPIEMIYISDNNQFTQRIIRIEAVKDTYIKAFCYTRNSTRTFKISNVLSVGTVQQRNYYKGA